MNPAQALDVRKTRAKYFFRQALKQYVTCEFQLALQSWQQALILYRELQDYQAEATTLGYLGLVYGNLGDNTKATTCFQNAIKIAQELKNLQLEAILLRFWI
ncbi:hypothetical protein [Coleofasciculus sp. LEGE 07092]|uniref:hypothetical protein n=2 Tax=unclassified Coleofasciculus TaxID=2692782 RepID=UPI00188297A4|nr:hypothetical protein [Coleofasciculus sp. LEGE 07092]MBE9128624.1 hypothetical protein [Coleofasciculus sp. LEGE 07081]MBE9151454.1 hypothetical protein [Coleofasciculus sp. LEGE 07092]